MEVNIEVHHGITDVEDRRLMEIAQDCAQWMEFWCVCPSNPTIREFVTVLSIFAAISYQCGLTQNGIG